MQLDQALKQGALYGTLATLVMTLIMLTGMGTGIAPMPEPIPKALAGLLLGLFLGEVATPVTMVTGMVAHFAYGAAAGIIYAWLFGDNCNWQTGLLWGVVLWIVMQLAVLPVIGWGPFGIAITGFPPKIAVGTLLLHLAYGGLLGWGVERNTHDAASDREPAQT